MSTQRTQRCFYVVSYEYSIIVCSSRSAVVPTELSLSRPISFLSLFVVCGAMARDEGHGEPDDGPAVVDVGADPATLAAARKKF